MRAAREPLARRRGCAWWRSACGLLMVLGVGVVGCATPQNVREGTLRGRVFPVAGSSLDWLEIAYTPVAGDVDFAMPCRLSLFGSGEIVYRTGRSPQVWDDFSTKVDDPNWNDVRVDRAHIGQDAMAEVLQEFVDAGVVPNPYARMVEGERPRAPMVKIRGKISGKPVARMVDNRRVVRLVEKQLFRFGGR